MIRLNRSDKVAITSKNRRPIRSPLWDDPPVSV